jgi:hypothetical protein
VNPGGWLLLSVLFSVLMMIVQRAERKRRLVTAIVMLLVGVLIWQYALYRMWNDCDILYKLTCNALRVACNVRYGCQQAPGIAISTVNWAIGTALIFNLLFWVLLGRYNPPGSSDSIKVLGMDD